jgi:hypothetical protein
MLLLLSGTASSYARQEGGRGEHSQQGRPAQQQARPAQQQGRPAQQQGRPTQQQRQSRPAAQAPMVNRAQQHAGQARAQQPEMRAVHRGVQSQPGQERRDGHEHGRIANDHYAAHFGSGHSFHVRRGDYDHRRFRYGGYAFGFIDPWPMAWGYSDDVYVEYSDGGYFMYNRVHPGVRISISIL